MSNKLLEHWDTAVAQIAAMDFFSYEFLSMMTRVASDSVSTMGVGVKNSQLMLYYNVDFVNKLSKRELAGVLVHEVLHVALHHVTKFLPQDPKDHQRWNVAFDLAINCLIPPNAYRCLPEGALLPGEGLFKKLDKYKAAEYYYQAIKKDPDLDEAVQQMSSGLPGEGEPKGSSGRAADGDKREGSSEGGQNGPLDDHSGWGGDVLLDGVIRDKVERIARTQAWGSGWGQTEIAIITEAQRSKIPWQSYLRHELGKIKRFSKKSDIRRNNRRLPRPFCGKRTVGVDPKLVAVDTSGSTFSKEIQADFFAEVAALAKVQPVDIVFFGDRLESEVTTFKNVYQDYRPVGGGGTDFKCIYDLAEEKGYSSVILLTDGYAEVLEEPSIKNLIICLTPDGRWSAPYGTVIQMEE